MAMDQVDHIVRVGVDATPSLVTRPTGTETYGVALVRQLAAIHHELGDVRLKVYLHAGNPFASAGRTKQMVSVLEQGGLPYRVYVSRRGYGLALSAYAAIDRVHLLHMLRVGRPWFLLCPHVMTVFDILSVDVTEDGQLIECVKLSPSERRAIKGADGLVAISDSLELELRKEFEPGELEMPLGVIHLGVDADYFDGPRVAHSVTKKYGLDKYILFVGTLEHHKNVPRLVEAFARLKVGHAIPHKLVLAGGKGSSSEAVDAAVRESGIADQILGLGYVPRADLPGLYAGADLFAFPTLHEGFGIPLLEAMASGTVVLASRVYSIPEVASDAAIYVDPHDVDAIAAGLERALSDHQLRTELVAIGLERAKQFTWRKMAIRTIQFYGRVVNEGRGLK